MAKTNQKLQEVSFWIKPEDIEKSTKECVSNCPLARGLASISGMSKVAVSYEKLFFTYNGVEYTDETPAKMRQYAQSFDAGQDVGEAIFVYLFRL